VAANDFYVDNVAGSDNNGGTSAGSAKVSGTAGATNGTTTVDLSSDTPDLSAVVVGDCIRINSEINGRRSTDLFEITAVDDGLDTVTVTPTPGTASGLTWAIGGAFVTINRFMDTTLDGAGDKCWVKGGTDYTETITIDVVAAIDDPCVIEGYTTTPGDDGRFTINGGGTRGSGVSTIITSGVYHVFKNMRSTNHTGAGISGSLDNGVCKNCKFDNNGGSGVQIDDWWRFEECEFSDNIDNGCHVDSSAVVIGCRSYRNAGDGIKIKSGLVFGCVCYSNGGAGITFTGLNLGFRIAINNTIDGDSKDSNLGIYVEPIVDSLDVLVNNIVHDCVTGIESPSGQGELLISRNNLLNANTDNYAGGAATYAGEVLDVPGFVDEASQDYRLNIVSPARNAGFDESTLEGTDLGMDIGARQQTLEQQLAEAGETPPLYPWHVGGA
jgi:hypothetical protein